MCYGVVNSDAYIVSNIGLSVSCFVPSLYEADSHWPTVSCSLCAWFVCGATVKSYCAIIRHAVPFHKVKATTKKTDDLL